VMVMEGGKSDIQAALINHHNFQGLGQKKR
jgi:hypothetical protein